MTQLTPAQFAQHIKSHAHQLGFELVGLAHATKPETLEYFHNWLDQDFAGEMKFLEQRRPAYSHPEGVLPGVKTVIMLGLNYRHVDSQEQQDSLARISLYAQTNQDYHHVIRGKLRQLAQMIHQLNPACRTRGIVDTAPLLERDFARRAGLGWFGKNTLLINKKQGSFIFLAGMLTDWELPTDEPHLAQHCGSCTRCLEACPTHAFVKPYQLDARICISYLTIELRDQPIPDELRPDIGNWIMGCDVCQDVCPWNRKSVRTVSAWFKPLQELQYVNPQDLLRLTEEEFKARFRETPLVRPGRVGIIRNLVIALGNKGDALYIQELKELLNDKSPIIRGAVVYSLRRIANNNNSLSNLWQELREYTDRENDPYVLQELELWE